VGISSGPCRVPPSPPVFLKYSIQVGCGQNIDSIVVAMLLIPCGLERNGL
jgi:hypothetical protein